MKMPYVRNFFREFFWVFVSAAMAVEIQSSDRGVGWMIALLICVCGIAVDECASSVWRRLFPPDPKPSVWKPARAPAWWEHPIKHKFLAAIGFYATIIAIIGIISERGS